MPPNALPPPPAPRPADALHESDELLRLLIGAVQDYAIFMLDPQGHVLTWNSGAEQIKGYAAHEVTGRHFSMFFTDEDRQAGVPPRELQVALASGRAEAEGWRVRKSGELFWANVVITPVRGPDGTLRGFAKVTRDLSQQRRMAELEHSSQRMKEFLAMLAHELRNPLAPMRNVVQILSLKGDLPGYVEPLRQMMDRQVRQLTRLVDDLLDVARITTGKILLRPESIDLRDVVQASVEALRATTNAKQQALSVQLPEAPLRLTGDATRLAQALQNLIANASRYTPSGGRIHVSVVREGATVAVRVSDNGIGLEPEAIERIFGLFAQEKGARDPSDAGLGIGLSLARKIVELHAGSLTAESPGPGLGSIFTLRLPLAELVHGHVVRPAAPLAAESRRVLVIDDNVDAAQSMETILGLLGHQARSAFSGAEGVVIAEAFAPDVVLLDLNMPELDGFAVLKQLRARFGRKLVIAAVTGYGRQGDRRATLATGFDEHLTKPVSVEQLQAVLRR